MSPSSKNLFLLSSLKKDMNRKFLNLSNSNLHNIPKYVFNMINLEKLDLSINELTILPFEIMNLTNLKELTFDQSVFVSSKVRNFIRKHKITLFCTLPVKGLPQQNSLQRIGGGTRTNFDTNQADSPGNFINNKIIHITMENIRSLDYGNWLEDIVIEAYCKYLIINRDIRKDVKIADTYFYPNNININQNTNYLIPIFESSHWSLIFIENNILNYYDSQIRQSHTDKVISKFPKYLKINIVGGSQQVNNDDCGVYVCYNINRILKSKSLKLESWKANMMRDHLKKRLINFYQL